MITAETAAKIRSLKRPTIVMSPYPLLHEIIPYCNPIYKAHYVFQVLPSALGSWNALGVRVGGNCSQGFTRIQFCLRRFRNCHSAASANRLFCSFVERGNKIDENILLGGISYGWAHVERYSIRNSNLSADFWLRAILCILGWWCRDGGRGRIMPHNEPRHRRQGQHPKIDRFWKP